VDVVEERLEVARRNFAVEGEQLTQVVEDSRRNLKELQAKIQKVEVTYRDQQVTMTTSVLDLE